MRIIVKSIRKEKKSARKHARAQPVVQQARQRLPKIRAWKIAAPKELGRRIVMFLFSKFIAAGRSQSLEF